MNALLLAAVLAAPVHAQPALVQGVRIEPGKAVVRLSKPAGFSTKSDPAKASVVVTLSGADIPEEEPNVTKLSGMVRWVSANKVEGTDQVRITIRLDQDRPFTLSYAGSDLVLVFGGPPPAEPKKPAPPKSEPPKAEPPKPEAPKPPPAKADAPKPARPSRGFRVQLASRPDEEDAIFLKERYQETLKMKLELREGTAGGKTVYRVSHGPFPDRAAAQAFVDKAKAAGLEAIVVKD